MTYCGSRYGVSFFDGTFRWYDDLEEAKAIDRQEVAKFLAADRAREAARLERLGVQADLPLSYRVSLAEIQPGKKQRRRLS